ncbi:enediyne biosynthesis thioesterase [Nocardia tenerifensis]|uniref:Enediyne biosynthesis thioesterase n=1 Tax=Nocardia tenerifensis TaxID=228006 RepID=A0A318K7Z9_9NOCA|nr:acyl-CoA thioesterase [Nocardia tenerifensis]PXX69235.1 enediyne biosynthesis thioesterase [Nocardia tenerifensis]
MTSSKPYELEKIITLADTNAIGNVYFASYVFWQGECRERCLAGYGPQLQDDMRRGLLMVTASCACEYLDDLRLLDQVLIRMTFGPVRFNTVELIFEYLRRTPDGEKLVARGRQTVAVMRHRPGSPDDELKPAAWPKWFLSFAAEYDLDTRRAHVALG